MYTQEVRVKCSDDARRRPAYDLNPVHLESSGHPLPSAQRKTRETEKKGKARRYEKHDMASRIIKLLKTGF